MRKGSELTFEDVVIVMSINTLPFCSGAVTCKKSFPHGLLLWGLGRKVSGENERIFFICFGI
jgi:hypothetical protein